MRGRHFLLLMLVVAMLAAAAVAAAGQGTTARSADPNPCVVLNACGNGYIDGRKH
jgi:hypothetical protein